MSSDRSEAKLSLNRKKEKRNHETFGNIVIENILRKNENKDFSFYNQLILIALVNGFLSFFLEVLRDIKRGGKGNL